MLGEEPAAYNVLSVGDNGNCTLRRLRWCVDPGDKLQPDVAKRLGDGKNGTTLWRYSDRRYTILTAVALGETMKYGARSSPASNGHQTATIQCLAPKATSTSKKSRVEWNTQSGSRT